MRWDEIWRPCDGMRFGALGMGWDLAPLGWEGMAPLGWEGMATGKVEER
jgi:hypothetical protein